MPYALAKRPQSRRAKGDEMRTANAWLRWLAILLAMAPPLASALQPATTTLTGLPSSAVPDGAAGVASGSVDFSLRNLSCNGTTGRLCGS